MKTRFVGSILGVASIAAVPLAALSISATAGAQANGQRELFDWRGNVDQEVRVQMHSDRTSVIPMGPREMTGYDNARTMSGIPSTDGYVTVQMREGRGYADVVEQPSAQNGFTTVVRIRDTQGGVGSYDVAAFWQPMSGYGYGDNAQYDQYGNYDTYNSYGAYGNPGVYQTYPQVIVEQPVYRPEYRPVYGDRDNIGRAVPAPERAHDNSHEYPARPQYPTQPNHAPGDGRYQNDNRSQNGNAHESRPTAPTPPVTRPSQGSQTSHQPDKAVPRPASGTTSGTDHHDGSWQRGH